MRLVLHHLVYSSSSSSSSHDVILLQLHDAALGCVHVSTTDCQTALQCQTHCAAVQTCYKMRSLSF